GVAAGERIDRRVAELSERLGRKSRAVSGGAVEDNRLVPVGNRLLDPRLDVAARDVDRSGDVPLVPLVALADVHEGWGLVGGEQARGLGGVYLIDLGLDLLQELA